MYVEIKDDKLLSWCEKPYLDYEFVDIDYESFTPEKYEVLNGALTDISDTQQYKDKKAQEEREKTLADLKAQVAELDLKRIRAIAEPKLKDESQTWLEYYTQEIIALRAQIADL